MASKHEHGGHLIHHRGFTLIECLIGLAITAMLLTAVAVAFNASVINYAENEETYWAVNNARQALARMTSQIRTGNSFNTTDPNNRCSFFTATNENTIYEYRSADRKLYLITGGHEYMLCDNVVAATFNKTITGDGLDIKSVQILLTVQSGKTQRTLSAAAVVRRNLGT